MSDIWLKMCNGLPVKYPCWLSDTNETWIFIKDLLKLLNIKFHANPSRESRVISGGQTDIAFRNFTNAPIKWVDVVLDGHSDTRQNCAIWDRSTVQDALYSSCSGCNCLVPVGHAARASRHHTEVWRKLAYSLSMQEKVSRPVRVHTTARPKKVSGLLKSVHWAC
jgi:hypothetical protein